MKIIEIRLASVRTQTLTISGRIIEWLGMRQDRFGSMFISAIYDEGGTQQLAIIERQAGDEVDVKHLALIDFVGSIGARHYFAASLAAIENVKVDYHQSVPSPDWCRCPYPTVDHVSAKTGTCGECGLPVSLSDA